MKKKILAFFSVILVLVMLTSCGAALEKKSEKTYAQELEQTGLFDSTVEQAMPQTVIHKLITEHFDSPLPQGKTVKKAIFIGYDGFRADGIENIAKNEESAIMHLKQTGGLYHTFSGGIKGVNEQATSTAPSWMAMLTGGWGEYNSVTDNGQMKNSESETFLTSLAKSGYTASFTTSWREHTELSYRPDIVMAIQEGLPIEYTHQIDDTAVYYQILKYVSKPENSQKTALQDPDVIFFTLEHTDHAGHTSGFGNQNEEYIKACNDADAYGYEIIKTIQSRATYNEEDWLIIISTDHGGTKKHHGGQTLFERMTWLACNKPIEINSEYMEYANEK